MEALRVPEVNPVPKVHGLRYHRSVRRCFEPSLDDALESVEDLGAAGMQVVGTFWAEEPSERQPGQCLDPSAQGQSG